MRGGEEAYGGFERVETADHALHENWGAPCGSLRCEAGGQNALAFFGSTEVQKEEIARARRTIEGGNGLASVDPETIAGRQVLE